MPDNPQARAAQEFRLPGHAVLALAGRDALAFAQAQFMNDVAALADGQWQWNGWLTPKGRVLALFALLRLDAETVWLVLPESDATALGGDLRRFVFRSKVTLTPLALSCCGGFIPPAHASASRLAHTDDGSVELDMGGAGGARTLRIGGAEAVEDAAAVERWDAADLAHGLPRLRDGQIDAWTPQQLSLQRLAAFSVKKGCYPGQEIVARTHFLGQAKRGLARYRGAPGIAEGQAIDADGRTIGTVVAVRGEDVVGVVSLDATDAAARCGDVDLAPLPLLDGLARGA